MPWSASGPTRWITGGAPTRSSDGSPQPCSRSNPACGGSGDSAPCRFCGKPCKPNCEMREQKLNLRLRSLMTGRPLREVQLTLGLTRDYFIVPLEVLFGITGFQPGAPSRLRLRAEDVLTSLARNLRHNDGAYRPAPGDRFSS